MTNLQQDDNGSQAQIMPPGTISQNVPDEKPQPFASDSYNKGGGSYPSFVFTGSKSKRKPLDWMAIASSAARTGLRFMLGFCIASGILFATVLWLNWLVNLFEGSLDISSKIAHVLLSVAMFGVGVGAWNSYHKQRNS